MKKKLYAAMAIALSILAVSCKKVEPAGPSEQKFKVEAEAGAPSFKWKDGDLISVFTSDKKSNKFTVSQSSGRNAVASGIITPESGCYAFFPYSAAPSWDGSAFSVKCKSIQTATENGVASGTNFYVAREANGTLNFKGVMSYLKVSGDFGKQEIKSITLSANEPLAGVASISFDGSNITSTIASSPTKSITFMGSDVIESGKSYYICVLPGNYTGLKLVVTSSMNEKKTVEAGSVTVERNKIQDLPQIKLPDDQWELDPEDQGGPYNYAQGKVSWSDGTPAAGVVVSDGFRCVQTDKDGKFKVNTCSDTWYIYISMPSNAKIEKNTNGCPDFFVKYDKMEKNYNFTLTKQAVENDFSVFAMADPQAHNAARSPQKKADTQRFLEEAVPSLNKHISEQGVPSYGITLGDIVYSEGSRNSTGGMTTMRTNFSKVNMPVFQTMGNHDFTYFYSSTPLAADATSSTTNLKVQRKFEDTFGPINFSFNRGKTHFICMKNIVFDSTTDASSYHCGFSDEQYTWFTEDIRYVPSDYQVVLCVHIPVTGCTGANNTHVMDILNKIKTYPNSTVFSGHTHYYRGLSNVNSTGMFEHIHSAVCGQWWWSKVEGDGAPAGYHIYRFADGKIKDDYFCGFNEGMNTRDYQMRLYRGDLKTGGSYAYFQWPHSSSTLLINVFNGDSRWKVEVYENDVLKGTASMMINSKKTFSSVTKGQTYDIPTSSNQDWWAIGLHIGYIGRGVSSTSYYTNMFHMWKFTLSDPNAKVKVVATDPFGTKYTCTEVVTDGLNYPMMYRAW